MHDPQRLISVLRRERSGSVAVALALALLPVVFAVGLGVDYARLSAARARLLSAADAAALAAVTAGGNGQEVAAGVVAFDGNAAPRAGERVLARTVVVTTTETPGGLGTAKTAVVKYEAEVETPFAAMAGLRTRRVAGSARAGFNVGDSFTDYYLLLDVSGSMQVPATQQGRSFLRQQPLWWEGRCEVACHWAVYASGENMLAFARRNRVELRYDQMIEGARNFINIVRDTNENSARINRLQILTFAETLDTRTTMNSNFTASAHALGSADSWLDGGTRFDKALPELNRIIGTQGDGTSSLSPRKVVVLITDASGKSDCTPFTADCYSQIDNKDCSSIKNKGVPISLIRVAYLPLNGDNVYDNFIAPNLPRYAQAAKNCASQGLYFEADSQLEINAAFALAYKGLGPRPRLVN